MVDTELVVVSILTYHDVALVGGHTNLHVTHTGIVQYLLHTSRILVRHLDDNTRILGKQCLYDVATLQLVEVHIDTAFHVGKAHFQQAGQQTTGRDVVSGHDETFVHQLLYGQESIAEIFGILHRRHVATHFVEALCKGRTTQLQGVE